MKKNDPKTTDSFNLVVAAWIPVLWVDGRFERVGIGKALTEAGRIRQIAATNPMDNAALLRLLLAVLQWCKPNLSEQDRRRLRNGRGIPTRWLGELQKNRDAFNLLGSGSRFMQHNDRRGNLRPVADLLHELPGATNIAHFFHLRDYRDGVCPACAAIGFVRLPPTMTEMGRGKRPGINGKPPWYFIPVGRTLLDTLTINWPFDTTATDRPFWAAKPGAKRASNSRRVGILQGFTWLSRQYRIADDGVTQGRCAICAAQTDLLVTKLHELNRPSGGMNLNQNRWRDPHVAYREAARQGHKPYRAADSEEDLPGSAGEWREIRRSCIGAESPTSVARAREKRRGTQLQILAAALVSRKAKAVEMITAAISVPGQNAEGVLERLDNLDKVIKQLFDPRVELTKDKQRRKQLQPFKDRHPLKTVRSQDRPLPESVRSALADRLPYLESMLSRLGDPEPIKRLLKDSLDDVVRSTTAGSPLRRREALDRARRELNRVLL